MNTSSKPVQVDSDSRWRIDKHIPIPLLVGLIIQTAVVLWTVSAKLSEQTERLISYDRRITTLEAYRLSERVSVVESQMSDIKLLLLRMDQRTEIMSRQLPPPR
jgi:Tfp pilus assembly protein PilO